MIRSFISHLINSGVRKKPSMKWLKAPRSLENRSGSRRISERRFFDPKEELLYKSNQAKTRMYSRFHQSF